MLARSPDGLSFTRANQVVTDQGDVPDLVVDSDGVVYLYYVGATVGRELNKIAVAISRDRGETWTFHKAVLEGFEGMSEPVDPDVVILPDGTFRLFVTSSVRGERLKTYYAEGRDGIRFSKRGVAFEPPGEPLDPNVFFAGGMWRIFAGGQTSRPGANWRGTSPGGTSFTFDGEEMFVKDGLPHAVSNAIAVDGGYRMYAFPHALPPVIHSFFSSDGVSWSPEAGVRLAMDPAAGLESEGVKDAAVARLADDSYLMVYVTVIDEPRVSSAWDLEFRPDPGIRIAAAQLPKPWVSESGEVHLYFEDLSTGRPRELRAVSSDGLVFTSGEPPPDRYGDPRRLRLPDGAWRLYLYDPRAGELRSSSSQDGLSFTPDPGARYLPHPEDRGSMGVYDHFTDSQGGVVLLYVGDMQGLNNLRRAYSPPGDNGWTFQFDRGNILGDAGAGGGPNSFVDPKSIRLPDGRIRLFVMRQGTIHSFISEDEGHTFQREEGERLSPGDFREFDVRSLHDPWAVRLPDGRYRLYAAAAMGKPDAPARFAIVSATTALPATPDVYFDGSRWVLYISHGAGTSAWTSSSLRGAFTKVGDLTAAGGGVPCGYFDAASQRYWTFAHTARNGVSVIRRAVHSSLSAALAENEWQTVLTGPDLGLSAKAGVESPDVVALRDAQSVLR